MKGYTKLIDDRYVVRGKQPDSSWLPIERDSEGLITSPLGLKEQEYVTDVQDKFRQDRDALLKEVDGYQLVLRYESLTVEQKAELATYRQALLDSTTDWVMPDKPTWM